MHKLCGRVYFDGSYVLSPSFISAIPHSLSLSTIQVLGFFRLNNTELPWQDISTNITLNTQKLVAIYCADVIVYNKWLGSLYLSRVGMVCVFV